MRFFRDYLNANEAVKQEYELLKDAFFKTGKEGITEYTNYKEQFVQSVFMKMDEWRIIMTCIFCEGIEEKQILLQTKKFKVVLDIDPIQSGHLLIISKQHFMDVRELSDLALIELFKLQKRIIDIWNALFGRRGKRYSK